MIVRISALQMKLQNVIRLCRAGIHFAAVLHNGVKGMELRMPALSPTMSQGTIIKWLKNEGDQISPGDALCEIQTDKAVMTYDVEEEGILAKILMPNDSKDVNIGTLIAILVEEGQDWKQVEIPTGSGTSPGVSQTPSTVASPTVTQEGTHKITLGPAAKKLLLTFGLNESAVAASGPRKTLLKSDILKFVAEKKLKPVEVKSSPPAVTPTAAKRKTSVVPVVTSDQVYVDIPNSEWRKSLAHNSLQSKTNIPHSYCAVECQIDDVIGLQKTLKEDNVDVSLDDFIIKAAAVALQRVPEANAQWTRNNIRLLSTTDVAVTIQTNDGPVSVVITDVIGTGISDISDQLNSLSEKASKGELQPSSQSGGSITVSNLISHGITEFVTVVPEHQSTVLTIGMAGLVIDDKGQIQSLINANLSYDRRVFDEEVAARFLSEFAAVIESPALMLAAMGPSEIHSKSALSFS